MLKYSTGTFTTSMAFAAMAASSASSIVQWDHLNNDSFAVCLNSDERDVVNNSGTPFIYYPHIKSELSNSHNIETSIRIWSIKMQIRYQAIENSFLQNSNCITTKQKEYIAKLANHVCYLPFCDNMSSYNEFDDSIDTMLKLSNGLTLRLSQFLDNDVDSPVVFSIYRDKALLVSDELPLEEIVDTINSVQ